jgi:hydroxymethylpyrimidine/phosphomethylpyrimidine kinase
VTDLFLQKNSKPILFESDRIVSKNLHGTGCTLSSAIASYLAKGFELEDAVRRGRGFLIEALSAGVLINLGDVSDKDPSYAGPLNHGFKPLPTDPK